MRRKFQVHTRDRRYWHGAAMYLYYGCSLGSLGASTGACGDARWADVLFVPSPSPQPSGSSQEGLEDGALGGRSRVRAPADETTSGRRGANEGQDGQMDGEADGDGRVRGIYAHSILLRARSSYFCGMFGRGTGDGRELREGAALASSGGIAVEVCSCVILFFRAWAGGYLYGILRSAFARRPCPRCSRSDICWHWSWHWSDAGNG